QPFFYDQKRERAVATQSSYEWHFDGITARQASELLEEIERRKREIEDAATAAGEGARLEGYRRSLNERAQKEKADGAADSYFTENLAAKPAPAPAAAAPMEAMPEKDEEASGAGPGGGAMAGKAMGGRKMADAKKVNAPVQ